MFYWYMCAKVMQSISMSPWENLGNHEIGSTEAQGTVVSFFRLCQAIGAIGVVCTLIASAIMLIVTKNGRKREEAKTNMGHKIIVGICVFGAVGLIGRIAEIVLSLM